VWSGQSGNALELVRDHWPREIYPKAGTNIAFEQFWEKSLQDGFAAYTAATRRTEAVRAKSTPAVRAEETAASGAWMLVLYAKPALLDGRHAYNPWLQEVPDPVTKVAWDNYASLAPAAAVKLAIASGDVVRIQTGGQAIELPALIQPGQDESTVAVALGYGSTLSTRFARVGPQWLEARPTLNEAGLVGVNAAPLLRFTNGVLDYGRSGVSIAKTGKTAALACTQEHHSVTAACETGAGRRSEPSHR
jgi:molybdopterin-containing oxidoreductase family iron-sulfur binding subunit